MKFPALHLVTLGAGWLLCSHASAQYQIVSIEEESGGSKLELTAVFAPPPPGGCQPVRVEATNATGAKRSWRLDFSASMGWNDRGALRSTFEVAAEPGSTQSTVLVPVPAVVSSGGWRYGGSNLNLQVTASGNPGGRHSGSAHAERAQVFPAVAISDALAQKSLTQLDDETGNVIGKGFGHEKIFGSRFRPEHLPDNWLGYSGFDHLMMTGDEWLAVAPGVRTAILQAANFGLQLHLYRPNASVTLASLGFPNADPAATSLPHGMGRIVGETWDGNALDPAVTVPKFWSLRDYSLVRQLSEGYSKGAWGLEQALGERSFAGWQVVLFLLLFGLLVGPVNLFVLAPVGKRHKLFFTTPLISLGASVLLIGLILIQDGTGGVGRRFIAIHLPPGEATALVTQEQISRTGVVLGSSFSLPRPGTLNQIVLSESAWAKFHDGSGSQPLEGRIDGTQVSGNWFQSRAVQAQFLRSAVPTRGRLEVVPPKAEGEAPSILSSLDLELTDLTYLDADGTVWRAESPVTQGRAVTLVKANQGWWSEQVGRFGDRASPTLAKNLVRNLVEQKPAFLATAAAAPGFAIDTLPSIRWSDDRIAVFGNLPAQP